MLARSACPLPYRSAINGATPDPPVRPTGLCLVPRPGAAQRGRPPAQALGAIPRPAPVPWDVRHALRRERGVSPGERGAGVGGPRVPHDRMQGGGDGSALGFCEGKSALSPCVDSPEHRQAPRGHNVRGSRTRAGPRPAPPRRPGAAILPRRP